MDMIHGVPQKGTDQSPQEPVFVPASLAPNSISKEYTMVPGSGGSPPRDMDTFYPFKKDDVVNC